MNEDSDYSRLEHRWSKPLALYKLLFKSVSLMNEGALALPGARMRLARLLALRLLGEVAL
jgi:hypothetical protein